MSTTLGEHSDGKQQILLAALFGATATLLAVASAVISYLQLRKHRAADEEANFAPRVVTACSEHSRARDSQTAVSIEAEETISDWVDVVDADSSQSNLQSIKEP